MDKKPDYGSVLEKPTPPIKPKEEKLSKGITKLIAGGTSAAISSVLVQPLDVIKTRQQQRLISDKSLGQLVKYHTTWDTCKTIVKEEKIAGLWKGTAPTLYRVIPGAGINFLFLHHLTTWMAPQNTEGKHLTGMNAFIAGSTARTLSTVLMIPISVVKTRFEGFGTNTYKNTYHALVTISRTEGLRGLFSGTVPSILRDAPFAGLYYLFYSTLQRYLSSTLTPSDERPGTLINLLAGGIAATIATVATHPQDLVKTRLQIAPNTRLKDVLATIMKEGGLRGFYKGLTPRLIRRPISNAVTWAIYEEIVVLLSKM